MAGGTADERRLADLQAANERREEALHARGKCTHDSLPALRSTVKLDTILEHLGLSMEAAIRIEERRAEGYDDIERRMREAELTKGRGIVAPTTSTATRPPTNGGLHVAK